jgi:purine-nucleoside phosphorylase
MKKALAGLLRKSNRVPVLSILLGTGFEINESSERQNLGRISFEEAGFKLRGRVDGHDYFISIYLFGSKPVLVFHGRLHLYEGYRQREVIFPVEVTVQAGVSRMLLTSASGGLSDKVETGNIVRVIDQINLTTGNPLQELSFSSGTDRFLDVSEIYKNPFSESVRAALNAAGLPVKDGIIAAMPGPIYETRSEALFLKKIGADIVSMSVAPEAIYAHYLGLETAAVSIVSNHHFKNSGKLTHTDIMNKIRGSNSDFNRFLDKLIEHL